VVVDPIAVAVGDSVIVPDLAEGIGETALDLAWSMAVDPVAGALNDGLSLLAEVAHRGARFLPSTFPERLTVAAQGLSRCGLRRCGEDLRTLARSLGHDPGDAAITAWVNAEIRLLTALSML
jgi:hypothetical protein